MSDGSVFPADIPQPDGAEFAVPPQDRRGPSGDYSRFARHLLALPHIVSEEDQVAVQRILGFSVDELASFGGDAYEERQSRFQAQTERNRFREQLKIDQNTGAYTWKAAQEIFGGIAIAAVEERAPFFCLFADLNSLKYANDFGGGHEFGDIYLKQTVSAINEFFRNTAKVIRLNGSGGDEFIVVGKLPGGRRRDDSPDMDNDEFTEIQHALKTFVKRKIAYHPELSRHLVPATMRAEGYREAGICVGGGVYILPEDLEPIGQDIIGKSLNMGQVLDRVKSIADRHMYLDKWGQRPEHQQFEYDDLFPSRSKFTA